MKLFEYQAKDAFKAEGIAVPRGMLCRDASGVRAAAAELGFPCVVKSQVLRGGRGKAGLIRLVKGADEAERYAAELFAGPHDVRSILVEEAVDIGREIYLAVTVDPEASKIGRASCRERV